MRILLVTLIASLGLLGPGLCLSGLVDHACDVSTAPEGPGHEEGCPVDPCGQDALRPSPSCSPAAGGIDVAAGHVLPAVMPGRIVPRADNMGTSARFLVTAPPSGRSAPIPLRI